MKANIPPYNDKTILTFGRFKGTALANVPSWYLLYLYRETVMQDFLLKQYIEENEDALELEKKNNTRTEISAKEAEGRVDRQQQARRFGNGRLTSKPGDVI